MSYLGMTDTQYANRIRKQAQRADAAAAALAAKSAKAALNLQLLQQSADTEAAVQTTQVAADTSIAQQQSDAKARVLRAVPWLIGGVLAIVAVAVISRRKKR